MEKKKEEVKALNSSLESTRLDLSSFFLEAQHKANLSKKLQEEMEAKAHLEELKRLIRDPWVKNTLQVLTCLKKQIFVKKDTNTKVLSYILFK